MTVKNPRNINYRHTNVIEHNRTNHKPYCFQFAFQRGHQAACSREQDGLIVVCEQVK